MRDKNYFRLTMSVGIFLLAFLAGFAHGKDDFSDLPKGPYCAGRYPAMRCCEGRKDDCSAPILTTTCYCDDFCNRTTGADCCPDYWTHCKGITTSPPPEPPPEYNRRRCIYKNVHYDEGVSIKDNCNKCTCTAVGDTGEMHCEANRCLIEPDLIDNVNYESSLLGWRAENHTEFWGKTLMDGIRLKLGTINPAKTIHAMKPVRLYYDPEALPKRFASQDKWAGKIAGISDQGWCGASWALSTVDVASDRYAIISKGREMVQLSTQHLLSCNNRRQQGCNGGHLDIAWQFVKRYGLVDDDCYPWTGKVGKCKLPKKRGLNLEEAGCSVPEDSTRTSPYKVGPTYRLGNETDIMQEIHDSGPVQATMVVYQDFFVYKSGIYKHTPRVESLPTGFHSVRITGWGEERTTYGSVKYWVVANSWGREWGEDGYFKIVRGVNECEIESFVLAAWPKIEI